MRKKRGYCAKRMPLDFTATKNASEKLVRKFKKPISKTPLNAASKKYGGIFSIPKP